MVEIGRRLRSVAASIAPRPPRDLLADAGLDPDAEGAPLLDAAAAAAAAARRFLLLDLRRVTGIDATTASAFAMLRRSLEARGVTMVLTGVADAGGVKRMLMANGVIAADGAWEGGRGCPAFETLDAALLWCEEHFRKARALSPLFSPQQSLSTVQAAARPSPALHANPRGRASLRRVWFRAADPKSFSFLIPLSSREQYNETALQIAVLHGLVADLSEQSLTLEDVLKMHLSEAAMLDICTANHPLPKLLGALESYMQERTLDAGAALFERGDAADAIYIVLSGSLVSVMDFTNFAECASPVCPPFFRLGLARCCACSGGTQGDWPRARAGRERSRRAAPRWRPRPTPRAGCPTRRRPRRRAARSGARPRR